MELSKAMTMRQLFSGSAVVVPLSFFPTLARAAFLSYVFIFLKDKFKLSVQDIGLFVGGFIFVSSLSSLVFGTVLDRLNIKVLMVTSSIIQSAVYMSLFLFNSLALVFVFCLLLNFSYLTLETAVRICISRLFAPGETSSALSLKSTLTNVAYAIGPLTGLWLNRLKVSPLLFCSVSALLFVLVILSRFALARTTDHDNVKDQGLFGSLAIMGRDPKLLKFTIASVLLAGVFGQFHIYVGQYLILTHSTAQMYEIINVVFVTNALTSILLQYFIGRRVAAERFKGWVVGCILSFVIGLLGFALSQTLYAWILFTAIFTVGEIIIQPLEFFYITKIAPPHLKGAYYSSQNLTYLGAASTPAVCGFILAGFNPLYFLLYLIFLLVVGGLVLYVEGGRAHQ